MGALKVFGLGLCVWGLTASAVTCELLQNNWAIYKRDFSIEMDDAFDCKGKTGMLAHAFFHLHAPKFNEGSLDFYKWGKARVKKMVFENEKDATAVARGGSGKITLLPPLFKAKYTSAYRASTLVHEIRHLDKDDPRHVDCAKGAYKGSERACDAVLYDDRSGSGFNFDVEYLAWVKNGATYNELTQEVLQSELNALIPDRFNQVTEQQIKQWR